MAIWNRQRATRADGADPESLAEVARMLRPAQVQSEHHRAAVRARLERAASPVEQRQDAGSLDGVDDSATSTHTHQVGHPDVGTVHLADIEKIDAERIARVTEQLAELMNHVSDKGKGSR